MSELDNEICNSWKEINYQLACQKYDTDRANEIWRPEKYYEC